jgi:hypothetical protein
MGCWRVEDNIRRLGGHLSVDYLFESYIKESGEHAAGQISCSSTSTSSVRCKLETTTSPLPSPVQALNYLTHAHHPPGQAGAAVECYMLPPLASHQVSRQRWLLFDLALACVHLAHTILCSLQMASRNAQATQSSPSLPLDQATNALGQVSLSEQNPPPFRSNRSAPSQINTAQRRRGINLKLSDIIGPPETGGASNAGLGLGVPAPRSPVRKVHAPSDTTGTPFSNFQKIVSVS